MADKLFYSYNSTWNNSNSLTYTKQFSYSIVLNPKNHIIAYDGKEYGVFHNENYISCIPQSNFINQNNVITGSSNPTYLFIKVPSDSLTLGNDNTDTNRKNISFDISINNGTKPIKYTVSGSLATGNNTLHIWKKVEVLKVSNTDTNFPINFGYFRYSTSPQHTYLPYIAFGPSNALSPITTVNIHNISSSSNFDSSTNNFIDNNNNKLYKWEICLLSSLGNTYYLSTNGRISTSDTSSILPNGKIQQHNIWGQSFNGTNDVYGTLTLNSDNKWEHFSSGEQNSYVLRSTYLKINTTSTDRSCRVEVNGNTIITGTEKLRGELQINDNYSSSDGRIVLNNKPATEASPTRLEILASNAKDEGMGLYNRTFTHTYSSSTNTNGNWWILRQTYSGVSNATDTNKSWKTILGDNVNVGIGETRPQAKLHVNGNTYIGSGTSGTTRYFGINTTPTGQSLRVTGDSYLGYNNGNVGIGWSPYGRYKLYVHGQSTYWDGGNSTNQNKQLYSIYSNNGWNYFAGRCGIGTEADPNYKLYVAGQTRLNGNVGIQMAPHNTYSLAVSGMAYASQGFYTYGNSNSWGGTNYAAININIVNRAQTDQTIQLFSMNSHNYKVNSKNAYSYWHGGIYTFNSSNTRFYYYESDNPSQKPSAYNFLIWNSTTDYPYTTYALYSFSANPENRGTVAITSGTSKNIVCLGVISISRSNSTTTTWSAHWISGSLEPCDIKQPQEAVMPGNAASGNFKLCDCFVGLLFQKRSGFDREIIKGNYKICSAIPVITSNFSTDNGYEVAAEAKTIHTGSFCEIMAIPTSTDILGTPTSFSLFNRDIGPYLAVWGRRSYHYNNNNAIGTSYDDAMVETGDGSIASIRITIFGYWE